MSYGFWCKKDVLLVQFPECGVTINTDEFCKILQNLRYTIQNKICGMLLSGSVILHESTCPRTIWSTVHLIFKVIFED